mmetsp:Transcript_21958/g.26753  ORF Transcript_21958/g.26753 Transcript_21958/m.26753 type:complete len:422 (+) Transcript_21958:114-1379(+)
MYTNTMFVNVSRQLHRLSARTPRSVPVVVCKTNQVELGARILTPILLQTRSLSGSQVKKTAVYDVHVALGGKMVEFAGYYLPVQYPKGVKQEHLHTRESASLFDVSHMGQVKIYGPDRVKFVEKLVVGDIQALEEGHSQLSVITNENGGIIDDTIITKEADHIAMVVNGACKQKDLAHFQEKIQDFDATLEHLEHRSLFALQGPKSMHALQCIINVDLSKMAFMTSADVEIGGISCGLARGGYTGEDGFEVSVDSTQAPELMKLLLDQDGVEPCGLGARDSLRLEAGMCLYGNDLDENTTPVEGSLLWVIGKRRREEGGFLGFDKIAEQIKNKPSRKRVGLMIDGPPARAHVELFDENQDTVRGEITSGTFSPCLKKPIAMGYVEKGLTKSGTKLFAKVRNKMVPATVVKMPFVPNKYYKI